MKKFAKLSRPFNSKKGRELAKREQSQAISFSRFLNWFVGDFHNFFKETEFHEKISIFEIRIFKFKEQTETKIFF